MLVGYARVSTLDQNPQLQIDALKQAGCERLYVEKASGAHHDRPELKAALAYMRPGDTLVVWGSPGWRDPSNKSSRPPTTSSKRNRRSRCDPQYRHWHARGALFLYHRRLR